MTIGYRKFLCLLASGLTLRYNFLFSDHCGHCGCNCHVRVHFVIFAALQHLVTCNRSKQGFLPEGCMPIYEYRCTDCGRTGTSAKMSDAPIAACPHCGGGAYAQAVVPDRRFSLKNWRLLRPISRTRAPVARPPGQRRRLRRLRLRPRHETRQTDFEGLNPSCTGVAYK